MEINEKIESEKSNVGDMPSSLNVPSSKSEIGTENDTSDAGFNYSYSAKRQTEVDRIKSKYVKKSEDKMEALRRLDRSVTKKANLASIILGTLGALILGTGMSLVMTDMAEKMNMSFVTAVISGVLIGIVGIALVALAYPIYKAVLRKEREKHASEILSLAAELEQNRP